MKVNESIICFLACLLILGDLTIQAQDQRFSQPLSVPTYFNPAFAGYFGGPQICTATRIFTWNKQRSTADFFTTNLTYDQYFEKLYGGIGINVQYDLVGTILETYSTSFAYSPKFSLFDGAIDISPALEIGWFQRRLDWSKVTFGDMIDPRRGFIYETQDIPRGAVNGLTVNSGVLMSYQNINFGLAIHNINQPNQSLVTATSRRLTIISGHLLYVVEFTPKLSATPSIIFQKQGPYKTFTGGISFYIYGFKIGFSNRFYQDALTLEGQIGFEHNRFSFGYSYDRPDWAPQVQLERRWHELSLSVRLGKQALSPPIKGPRTRAF